MNGASHSVCSFVLRILSIEPVIQRSNEIQVFHFRVHLTMFQTERFTTATVISQCIRAIRSELGGGEEEAKSMRQKL